MDTRTKIIVLTLIAGSNIGWAIAFKRSLLKIDRIMAAHMMIHGFDELLIRKIDEYDPSIFRDPEIQAKLTELEFFDLVQNLNNKG